MHKKSELSILVVGLGYVGLPLAVELSYHFEVGGYDIEQTKINKLSNGEDETETYTPEQLKNLTNISFSSDPECIKKYDVIIVAVPTPINEDRTPDFSFVKNACETISEFAKLNALIIFESTFYPGATEEICIPIIEGQNKRTWKVDFNVGYSPERINPGDKTNTLTTIAKIISGDSENTVKRIENIYSKIINAKLVKVSSIKTAEACKVLENTQRDVNIGLVNEFSLLLDKLDIDTQEVLEASKTKWNFLPFTPGLVGGHCIGIDPYYLIHKAESVGQNLSIVRSARTVNEEMTLFIKNKILKCIGKNGKLPKETRVNILGLTFKENCGDTRNSKAQKLIDELTEADFNIFLHDPIASKDVILKNWGYTITDWVSLEEADVTLICQPHDYYKEINPSELISKTKINGTILEIKPLLDPNFVKKSERLFWRL